MKKNKPDSTWQKEFRREAEARLEARFPLPEEISPQDAARLLHELRVYQIELEMQNEELRRAQADLEESRNRYCDLYDFAPVGHLTLDGQGRILEANLTAAKLLEVERSRLVGSWLRIFVHKASKAALDQHLQAVLAGPGSHSLDLRCKTKDHRELFVRLESLAAAGGEVPLIRTALFDITSIREAEQEIYRLANFPKLNPNPVLEVDREGRVLYANPAARQVAENLGLKEGVAAFLPPDLKEWFTAAREGGPRQHNFDLALGDAFYMVNVFFPHDLSTASLYVTDITQRQRAEEALRASEEFLRLAQQVAQIGTFEWNIQTGVNAWTPELEAMYGLPPGGFARTQPAWEDLVHPDDRAEAVRLVEQAFATGEPVEGEWRVVWPDGSVRWLDGRWQVFKDESGQPRRMTGVNIDITERRRMEDELRESRELFLQLAENIRDVFFVRDVRENRLLYMSPAYDEVWGLPREDLYQDIRAFMKVIHPEDLPRVLEDFHRHGQGDFFPHEYRLVHPDGRVRWVRVRPFAVRDKHGEIYRLAGIAEDITQRKQAEEALRESEERFRKIFENAATGIAITDWQGRFLQCNPAYCALLGYTEEELSRIEFASLLHPEDRDANLAEVLRLQAGELPFFQIENRYVHKDGQPVWVHKFVSVLTDAAGKPTHFLALVTDITERKAAEQALRDSREDLNRAQAVAHTGSWRMNVQRNELTWSEENHRIFGIPPGTAMTYETFLSTVHPEDREYVDREWTAALKGEPYDIEHRLVVEGQVKWVRERAELEFDPQGQLLGGFGTTQDITQRKQAEEALREALEEAERRQKETEALLHAARAVMEDHSFEDAAWEIFQQCKAMTGAPAGYIALLSPDGAENEVLFLDAGGMPCTVDPDLPMPIRGLREEAYRTGEVVFDNDFAASRHVAFLPAGHVALENVLFAPLVHEGKVVGLIGLANKPGGFTAHDARLAAGFGDLAAIALVSRRAEEALRKAHAELEHRVVERTKDLQFTVEQLQWEIEERAEAEARLKESETRFAAFMQHLPGIAAMRDLQGRYLFVNHAWEKFAGKNQDQWLGKTAAEIWPPDQAHRIQAMDRETIAGGRPLESVVKWELADGTQWWLSNRFPILGADGRLAMVGDIAIDITERQRAEEALERERQRLFAVLETMPAYVALLAPDYTVPYVNQEFARRFGRGEAGKRCYEFLFGRTEPCPDCQTFKVLETNQPQEWEWLGPDGRNYAVYDHPFTDADGSPLILEMGVDITDRKQAEEALRQNEALLREILETLPVGVWVADKTGQIAMINPAARRIWGGARYVGVEQYSEYKGWWADTGQPIAAQEWALSRALNHGERFLGEVIDIQGFDGIRRTILNSAAPIRGKNQEIMGAIMVNQDITELMQAQQARAQLAEILEATPDFVGTADAQGRVIYVNRAGRRLAGLGEDEDLSHTRVTDYHTPPVANLLLREAFPMARRKGSWQGESVFFSRDGREIPVSQVILAHKNPRGQMEFYSTIARDITERVRAEEEIRRKGAVFEAINRVFTEAITCDTDEELCRTSLAVAEELTGSKFGFIAVLNEKGTLDFLALSDPAWTPGPPAAAQESALPRNVKVRGIYRSVVRQGKSLLTNNPLFHPDYCAAPPDHPHLTAFLGVPLLDAGQPMGLIGLGNREGGYKPSHGEDAETLAMALAASLSRMCAEEEVKKSAQKLRFLSNQLIAAQESERKRLAAELHDELGHALLTIKLQLRALERRLTPEQRTLAEDLEALHPFIDGVLHNVRRLYFDLSPGDLDDLGLTGAVRQMLDEFAKYHQKIRWQIKLDNLDEDFPLPTQQVIYRLMQEILNNIGKHAQPSRVSVKVQRTPGAALFTVADNGRGFDTSQVLSLNDPNRGLGLAAMEERVRMQGGTLKITSQKGRGTRISFTLPLALGRT